MRFYRKFLSTGLFSAMEIAVVLVVVGVVSAIVAPHMSRGAAGSSPQLAEHVLAGQLRSLREAVRAYAADHDGRSPDAARIAEQLTGYTDWSGNVGQVRNARYRFGPYLREIPALPVGQNRGRTDLGRGGGGWVYDPAKAWITAGTAPDETDAAGRPYRAY